MNTNIKEKIKEMDRNLANRFITDIVACKDHGKWEPSFRKVFPRNAVTKEPFYGRNVLALTYACLDNGYTLPYFLTYKQALDLKGHVLKGESSHQVFFFTQATKREKADAMTDGAQYDKEKKEWYTLETYPCAKFYSEFAIEQCEGVNFKPLPEPEPKTDGELNALIGKIADSLGVTVKRAAIHDAPAYVKTKGGENYIALPADYQVIDWVKFNCAFLHELAHATADHGVERPKDTSYAIEELYAELGATFTANRLNIKYDYDNALAYVDAWSEAIKDKPEILRKACKVAFKISDKLCESLEPKAEKETVKPIGTFKRVSKPRYGVHADIKAKPVVTDINAIRAQLEKEEIAELFGNTVQLLRKSEKYFCIVRRNKKAKDYQTKVLTGFTFTDKFVKVDFMRDEFKHNERNSKIFADAVKILGRFKACKRLAKVKKFVLDGFETNSPYTIVNY